MVTAPKIDFSVCVCVCVVTSSYSLYIVPHTDLFDVCICDLVFFPSFSLIFSRFLSFVIYDAILLSFALLMPLLLSLPTQPTNNGRFRRSTTMATVRASHLGPAPHSLPHQIPMRPNDRGTAIQLATIALISSPNDAHLWLTSGWLAHSLAHSLTGSPTDHFMYFV